MFTVFKKINTYIKRHLSVILECYTHTQNTTKYIKNNLVLCLHTIIHKYTLAVSIKEYILSCWAKPRK